MLFRQTLRKILFLVILMAPSYTFLFINSPAKAFATPQLVWTKEFPNNPFTYSSPIPMQSNGGSLDIVLGSAVPYGNSLTPSDARIFNGDDGWTLETLSAPTNSVSVGDVDQDGNDDIFLGAGGSEVECQGDGGLYSFAAWGPWRFSPRILPDDAPFEGSQCGRPSVFASPALGDVNKDGVADASFGVLGLRAWSLNASNGGTNYNWPLYWDDTIYGSPALADITGDGQTEIIMPGDSSPGPPVDHRGGMVRALTGKNQQLWAFHTNEIVRSSPSIGDITGDGDIEIVFGTGNYWARQPGGATDCSKIFAVRRNGTLIWSKDIGAQTMASPTMADFNGDGRLDVAIGGWQRPCNPPADTNDGRVWILDGVTGEPLPGYPRASGGSLVIGQIVTADVNNDGGQDALVPTANGIHIFDGKNGNELYTLSYGGDGVVFRNSPLVTDLDSDGLIDIVVAGEKPSGHIGVLRRYEFEAADNAVLGAKGWHMNRKDPRQTGSWAATDLLDGPTGEAGKGYWMVASDGGIFPFGEARGYGSTGNIRLNQPMVGMASTPNGGGYWLVAADGGIFPFGNAKGGLGSTGNVRLFKPIVGMEASPSGNGYWLVAADGGIFPFGDAVGRGSTGNINLRQPVVGMARTASGNGYWLVAADGGIFPFGDAVGYGSTGNINLAKPIVGMERTASGNGYWLVAADGGIFPFGDAVGYGSAGNLPLVQPIKGMARFPTGGYTMAAADGGSFSYGAINYGSLGGLPLFQPIVGIAAVGGN
ncbi:MAG: VCBS repeat-containing protein [Patescibacteria group bacterium]